MLLRSLSGFQWVCDFMEGQWFCRRYLLGEESCRQKTGNFYGRVMVLEFSEWVMVGIGKFSRSCRGRACIHGSITLLKGVWCRCLGGKCGIKCAWQWQLLCWSWDLCMYALDTWEHFVENWTKVMITWKSDQGSGSTGACLEDCMFAWRVVVPWKV